MQLFRSESPALALTSILQRVGLTQPDGRPLYAYGVKAGELSRLGIVLHTSLQCGKLRTREEGAAFCLYAAERFCQLQEGGSWAWATVLEELRTTRDGHGFYEPVRDGLKWWGRKVQNREGKNFYLVTLAIEGGLPRSLIREGSHYRRFLRRVLVERERFPNLPPRDSATRFAVTLPKTLQNESVLELSTTLIDWALELRREVRGSDDPIQFLDERRPSWRSDAPIRLSAEGAEGLVGGLLRARKDGAESDDLFEVALELDLRAQSVRRLPVCPTKVEVETLVRSIGGKELPTRIQLYLRDDRGDPHHVASAAKVGDGSIFAVDAPGGARRFDLDGEEGRLDLVVKDGGGNDLGQVSILGGEPLDGGPWIFPMPSDDDPVRAIAMGSVRTRRESVLVAAPAGTVWGGEAPECVAELSGTARSVFVVTEPSTCQVDGEAFKFEVRAASDDDASYRLLGDRVAIGFGGSTVWRGCPRVLVDDPDIGARELVRADLQWKPRVGPWEPMPARPLGDGWIRYQADGATRFRTRVSIAPEDFAVRAEVGRRGGTGTVRLHGVSAESVIHEPEEGVEVRKVQRGGVVDLEVEVETVDERTQLALLVQFGPQQALELSTLLPVERRNFVVGREGRALRGGEELPLSGLVGMRAVAIQPGISAGFYLEGNGSGFRRQKLADLHDRGDGRHELPLDEIYGRVEALIGSDWSPRDFVELRICSTGFQSLDMASRIRIRPFRYRLKVHREESSEEIRIELVGGDIESLGIGVELRPMEEPCGEVHTLEQGADTGTWIIRGDEFSPGPWLVTAWWNDRLAARPTLVTIDAQDSPPSQPGEPGGTAGDLRDAVRRPEAEVDAAVDQAIEQLVELSGDEKGADGWKLIGEFLSTLDRLPPATFRVVRRLALHPEAVAMTFFRNARSEWAPEAWSSIERLPFLWHLVPYRGWSHGAEAERARFEALEADLPGVFQPEARVAGSWDALRDLAQRKAPFLADSIELAHCLQSEDPASFVELHGRLAKKLGSSEDSLPRAWNDLRIRKQDLREADWGNETMRQFDGVSENDVPLVWKRLQQSSYTRFMAFVREAPARAAFMSLGLEPEQWTQEHVEQLKRARDFDVDWFDTAFEAMAAPLVMERLMEHAKR
ncbi:MAG: STY4851/ECs_5259 family protein [Planctomycetota bacterium]|jgi:hypothetical protein